jgi:hypothetical protein
VVEGLKISIDSSFIEVIGFSRTHTWCIVCSEEFVGPCTLRTMHVLPLVNLHMSIFDPIVYFFSFGMHFSVVG